MNHVLVVVARNIKNVAEIRTMKIILASKEKFLLDRGYSFLGIDHSKLKIGFINTAFKAVEDLDYIKYQNEYYQLMNSAGIDFIQYDITNKTQQEIIDFFADRNVIQVSGGNAFYLLKAIRETGFSSILKILFKNNISYIGCSAGSYIMCPTIEVAGWKVDRNRYGMTDYTALNYVPFLLQCHYTDQKKEQILEKSRLLNHPLRLLKDDQGFLIEDGKIQLIGNGEEVFL